MSNDCEIRSGALRRRAILAAVVIAAVLVLGKLIAWIMTGSVAILGSLADSVLDVMASGLSFLAIRHAMEPPDHDHRFGHGKAEALAGLLRGLLVFVSAGYVGWEAVRAIAEPAPIQNGSIALAVLGGSLVMSAGLGLYQWRVYRLTRSVAIGADAANYSIDAVVSLGALIAVWLAGDPRFALADPLFGFAIAVIITVASGRIVLQAYDQLMDREMGEVDRTRIKEIVLSHPQALGVHDLRTRRSGADLFIQFHLELDPDMSLREAHRVADEVEALVQTYFPDAEILVHQEPVGEFIENELVRT